MPFLCVHMQSFPQMFSMTTVDTPNILSSIHHSLVEATFKQRSWFVWLLLSSDQICNTAGFFPLCNYPMLVMNCYVENIQSHFLPPLLHTSCKRLGYPRWATLWAITIWARDAGTAMKLKWTDEQTFINGTLSLSSRLHDHRGIDGGIYNKQRLSPAARPQSECTWSRRSLALGGLKAQRVYFLNQLLTYLT